MRSILHSLLSLVLLGAVASFGTGFGCTTSAESPDNAPDRMLAEVDSVDAPSSHAADDSLSVRLYGTVGPNGCYSLDEIEAVRSGSEVTLRPMVRDGTDAGRVCTMAIVPLDATHTLAPPFETGTLTVTVSQPGPNDVTATVDITPGSEEN